jgi:hypothetical protein
MNWFKISKNFSDRNIINNKIRYLNETRDILKHIARLVFQSGTIAKESNYKIIMSSKITSYPFLHDILIKADFIALDNPWGFASLCKEGVNKIDSIVFSLIKERKEITQGVDRNKKGLVSI